MNYESMWNELKNTLQTVMDFSDEHGDLKNMKRSMERIEQREKENDMAAKAAKRKADAAKRKGGDA